MTTREERTGFDEVSRDWTTLGAQDPLWAVHVNPDKRGGRWGIEEFLELGRGDVAAARERLARLGLPTTWDRVLDFGCGAGRLTQALAEHATEVVGVDVAEPMLATARELDRSGGRCRFVLNEAPDLSQFPTGSMDLVFSERVLQHLPAPVLEGYVGEFLRVLRPGGLALLHCTTRPLATAKGMIWRFVPQRLVGWGQRRVLGYPAPMRMTAVPEARMRQLVAAHGGAVVDTVAVDEPASHWHAARYVIRKDGGQRDDASPPRP